LLTCVAARSDQGSGTPTPHTSTTTPVDGLSLVVTLFSLASLTTDGLGAADLPMPDCRERRACQGSPDPLFLLVHVYSFFCTFCRWQISLHTAHAHGQQWLLQGLPVGASRTRLADARQRLHLPTRIHPPRQRAGLCRAARPRLAQRLCGAGLIHTIQHRRLHGQGRTH